MTYLESSGAIAVQVDQGGSLADVGEDHHVDDRGWRVATYLLAGPSLTGERVTVKDAVTVPASPSLTATSSTSPR